MFSWIPRGRPPPLLIRGNKVIKELTRRPQLALGLAELHMGTDRSIYGTLPRSGDGLPAYTEQLEPGTGCWVIASSFLLTSDFPARVP